MPSSFLRDRIASLGLAIVLACLLCLPAALLSGWPPALLARLWMLCAVLCVLPARRIAPTFLARFDSSVLYVAPPAMGDSVDAQPEQFSPLASWQSLVRWCHNGAGPGGGRFWQPWLRFQVRRPLAVAVLRSDDSVALQRFSQALCRYLDASPALEACDSTWAGLKLRLAVKGRECLWWRARQEDDPWDCGLLQPDALRSGALDQFRPRRATLLVLSEHNASQFTPVVRRLHERCHVFEHPVRLLLLSTSNAPVPDTLAVTGPTLTVELA